MDTIHKNTKIINPESAEVQLIWLCWHAHQFCEMDNHTQHMFWNTAQLALAEMGYDRQELAQTMTMYQQQKAKERLTQKLAQRQEVINV